MKLYYSPHVCSFVPHIILRELDIPFELVRVDFKTKLLPTGEDLSSITPKSYVPVLELPDGNRITELAVVIRYLADIHPEAKLAPPASVGSLERVRFDELLNFLATEFHKGFAPYTMMPEVGDVTRQWTKDRLTSRVDVLRTQLGAREYIFGDTFTVADPYTFWCLRTYSFLTKVPLEGTLKEYIARMTARPSVRAAVDVEKR